MLDVVFSVLFGIWKIPDSTLNFQVLGADASGLSKVGECG
jgi:hypothetical protein